MNVAKEVENYIRPPNEVPVDTRRDIDMERLDLISVVQTAFLSLLSVGFLLLLAAVSVLSFVAQGERWAVKRGLDGPFRYTSILHSFPLGFYSISW
jgi:hypothetical protein